MALSPLRDEKAPVDEKGNLQRCWPFCLLEVKTTRREIGGVNMSGYELELRVSPNNHRPINPKNKMWFVIEYSRCDGSPGQPRIDSNNSLFLFGN